MTCREKLTMERPDCVGDEFEIGCCGCPSHYDYLADPDDCQLSDCVTCWDREIPEVPNVVKDILKQGGQKLGINFGESTVCSIKDSGDRTLFDTGAVRDMREGKGRCDLMPLEVVRDLLQNENIGYIANFLQDNDTSELYECLGCFANVYGSEAAMLLEVAKHFEEGAKKYGENNWQKGIPVHCYIDSAVRHYLKWLRGDKDEPHDRAFVWNLMCCIWEVDYHTKAKEE